MQLQDEALSKLLAAANLPALAAEWLHPVDGAAEARDLLHRLLTHWRDLLGDELLRSKWQGHNAPDG